MADNSRTIIISNRDLDYLCDAAIENALKVLLDVTESKGLDRKISLMIWEKVACRANTYAERYI